MDMKLGFLSYGKNNRLSMSEERMLREYLKLRKNM
jgi:hypothetical protein